MSTESQGFHEAEEHLTPLTRDMHRALVSLQEELEAVDWYRQRADACQDEGLREVLLHNMREEIEHAAMVLEWLRRHDSKFEEQLKTYLFTEGEITEVEEETNSPPNSAVDGSEAQPPCDRAEEALAREITSRLTVGSLKEK
jgi:ferritin-like protein